MAHGTHGLDTVVENIYPRPQQTLARENISSLGVHSPLSYDPCDKPLAFHPRSSCHRNTTSSDVATHATPGRNGKYLSFSTTRPPPSSAIMNCTTKAVNVTYHELVDKLFHSYC